MEPQQGNINSNDMSAITAALSRRGMGDNVPALNQQSQGSPTAAPLPPQASGSMPTQTGMPQEAPADPTAQGNPEAKLILGAMKEYLARITPLGGAAPKGMA